MTWVRRFICLIRGHEDYLQFEPGRLYLQCISCGYESPGWTIDIQRPVLRFKPRPTATRAEPAIRPVERIA
jgi:hypothetical protein